jgi:hypothetical protein
MRYRAFSRAYVSVATYPLNVNAHPDARPAWFTSPAGAGRPGFQADRPLANYAQELVVQAGQAPDDHAFCCRIRRQDPRQIANHSGVQHPAGTTGEVIRPEPDDGHPQAIRSHPERHDDQAQPRLDAVTNPFGAFREGRRPKPHHERHVARSGQGSAGPQAVASAARPDRCDQELVE